MPLKIAINAQLPFNGSWGGVEQFTIGLISALGRLKSDSEQYVLVVRRGRHESIRPYLGANQTLVKGPETMTSYKELAVNALGPMKEPARKVWRRFRELLTRPDRLDLSTLESNGFYESLGVDIVHFPYQSFVRCQIPSIFHPHDIQHLHYPEFFDAETIEQREFIYRFACDAANAIVTPSQSAKDDLVGQYGVAPDKIFVIRYASPTELYVQNAGQTRNGIERRLRLPARFALYPAQTWPHKNHLRLLDAIHYLRMKEKLRVNVVCTGVKNNFWPKIRARIKELDLDEQVQFTGFISSQDLRTLYKLAQFVIFPSLFEGAGFPIIEAFQEGAPVACSAVTSLPEYAGDAALLFDPKSVESIADAIRRMHLEPELREDLRQKGRLRAQMFSWNTMAKAYRALYRQIAGLSVSEEDMQALAAEGLARPPTGEMASGMSQSL